MQKTGLQIKVIGEAVLRKKAKPVKKIQPYHRDILSQMAQLMYASSGIGLAAPQVGLGESMIVVDAGSGLYKLINPRIVKKQGRQAIEEGCLSVPGINIKVRRAKKVWIDAQNEESAPVTIEAEDLLACVLQHEIDHLHGKLIVDYATLLDKLRIKKQLKEIKKKSKNEGLPEPKRKSGQLQL